MNINLNRKFSKGKLKWQKKRETLKEMFNILSHKGNANQNYLEISSRMTNVNKTSDSSSW